MFGNMLKHFEKVSEFSAKKCNVSREILYGSAGFAGNSCKILLNKVDILRQICSSMGNFSCMKYVKCFDDFKNVVDSCFSIDLKPEYRNNIEI